MGMMYEYLMNSCTATESNTNENETEVCVLESRLYEQKKKQKPI